ncbi:MAG: hypothetical protein GY811_20920 [Myxococcales bacterium]|nr:hypothetical protein [Myxococcales bacterium]
MKRREFLRLSGCFFAAAKLSTLPACGGDDDEPTGVYEFPQGVASGDPRATSVIIWTRVQATAGGDEAIAVTAQVSEDEGFGTIVVEQDLEITSASDHTLRLLVTDLSPGTIYYYRFVAGGDTIVGRTITAPSNENTEPVHLAWVSCQDYEAGTYGAYRQMINDDVAASVDEQIQLVVHLGDFIYETTGGQFQVPLDADNRPIAMTNADGTPRKIDAFPSGGGSGEDENEKYAETLDDYRHLYKQFLRDPHLRAARARWPFIQTWDDHEFSDDCWQSQANYDSTGTVDEGSQQRKVSANQAWFEFIPANLSDAEGVPGVDNEASDFSATEVSNAPFDEVDADNFADEANNIAAIASLTIYRSIRYGKNVDFVVTDLRSYRSDHTIPEDQTYDSAAFFHPRTALPDEMIRIMDQGNTANGGNPPDDVDGLPNTRKERPPGTMLGAAQKAWWKSTMQNSDATWKIWCNEMPLMRFGVKVGPASILLFDRVAFCDAWDDKPTERAELMTFLKDQSIDNVVVLTGDIHAHFAGTLMDDYDAETQTPVATEFITAGISSNSLFSFFERAVRGQPPGLRDLVTFDATEFGGERIVENNLNVMLRYGTGAAQVGAETGDPAQILAAADPNANAHLKFADCNAQGYGLMTITPAGVEATLVTINRPIVDLGDAGQGIAGTASFTVDAGDAASLSEPAFTGTKPFPL